MRLVLPLLFPSKEICAILHISPGTLVRWGDREALHFHSVGKERRFLPTEVEQDLRRFRFGPPLNPATSLELRERVRIDEVLAWYGAGRRATLQRRMLDGTIPYYRIGQTYLFALDEIAFALGLTLVPGVSVPPAVHESTRSSTGGRL